MIFSRCLPAPALAIAVLFCPTLTTTFAHAQGTKLWSQSHYDEFEKGTPNGIAISSEGYLEAGPMLRTIAATGSTYVWSIAAGKQGDVFTGTGSPASVLQVTMNDKGDGKQTKLFESKDLSVQVVRVGPDGSIYAATLPSGKVYRLKPGQADVDESKAEVVFDPAQLSGKPEEKPKYIWDMAFDDQGRLYIATGAPAAIYRVGTGSSAKPEKFFTSDEQHLRCLLFEKDGSLIAGSDGDGLVYRIGKDGKGYVIYDAPKAEITALAESPEGVLYVAAVGEKSKSNLPPLPVQGNVSITATITIVQPGSIQASNNNGLIPEGSEIYEINREGAPRKLWAAHDDVIYALQATPKGLLAATGNRGHVYRVHEDSSFEDIAHAEASQVVAFAGSANGFYLGTSNSGKVLWLGDDATAEHSYESMVFDGGFFSRFGQADIDAPQTSRYDFYVRTGNVENPVRGWGEWQKVSAGVEPALASARFVQWKAVLHDGQLDAVGIHYLPVNVAPVVDEVVVVPGARANSQAIQQQIPQQISINLPSAQSANNFINLSPEGGSQPLPAIKDRTAVTARWAAHDDNGDDLSFRLYVKSEDEKDWLLLHDRTRERYYSFDAIHIPDGIYRLKVVASDAPSHAPGEAKTGERISDRFTVDTTPPVISGMTAQLAGASKVHVMLTAKDTLSTIDRAEYSIDAGRWLYLEPTGKLSDSKEEHYDFSAAIPSEPEADEEAEASTDMTESAKPIKASEHVITVRVYDRYGNVTAEKALVH